jgi:hypothetical protein
MSEQFEPAPSPFAPPAPSAPLIDVAAGAAPAKRKKWAVVAGVAAVAAVGVGVFAFGGSDKAEARYSLSAAAASAEVAQNVAYEMNIEVGAGAPVNASGTLDTENGVLAMSMTLPALGSTDIDVVFDIANKKMYMSAAAFAGQGLDVPTDWIGFDVSDLPGMEELFQQSTSTNPLDVAKVFDQAKSTEDLGVEDFRGEQVKHYRVVVSTADALAASPSMQEQLDQLGTDFPDELTYDVWVTAGSQLRRVTYDIPVAGQSVKADIVYTSVGTIDPIVVPAAADVTELSELMGG